MSMSSSAFRQRQNSFSADLDDLRQQNRLLYEENMTLKKSLEELITINTELTDSIEEFNNAHVEHFPHINQQEIEQLAHQVIELQQELERERIQKRNQKSDALSSEHHGTVDQTLKVIEELVNSIRIMQDEYQGEFQRIERQLVLQQNQWMKASDAIELKLIKFEMEYRKLSGELKKTENIVMAMERELDDRNKNYMSKKEMKISTTIEDLKTTLDKQIQEKNKVIKTYEKLLDGVKIKLSQKIGM